MKILIPASDAKKCYDFAREFVSAKNKKSSLDFGSNINRNYTDKIADAAEGKLGETAFSIMLKKLGIDYFPDFSITKGRLNTDEGQDVEAVKLNGKEHILSKKIDIKTAKMHCQWLLAEKHKFWADIYVLFGIDLPAEIEYDLTLLLKHLEKDVQCELKGYALKRDFFDSQDETWFKFTADSSLLKPGFVKEIIAEAKNQNEKLSKTLLMKYYSSSNVPESDRFMNVKLKAPINYGLPVFLIRKDIDGLKRLLLSKD